MKIHKLSEEHQRVWDVLQSLEDGERIKGKDLGIRANIKSERQVKRVIEVLRNNEFLVGGSKHGVMGYFEIRDEDDLHNTLRFIRGAAYSLLKTADKIEKSYFRQKYGELLLEDGTEEDLQNE